jgi:hypothetical protein
MILQAGREADGYRRLVTSISLKSTAVSSFLHTCRFVQNTAPSRKSIAWHCIAWAFKLFLRSREARRLKVFENRLPSRIFGSRTKELIERWRKLHKASQRSIFNKY